MRKIHSDKPSATGIEPDYSQYIPETQVNADPDLKFLPCKKKLKKMFKKLGCEDELMHATLEF